MNSALHVAILDDEVDITQLLANHLQSHGYRVTQLHDGQSLMETMAADPPPLVLLDLGCPARMASRWGPGANFDLLLTDIALGPGMHGTQLAAEAQRRFPELAILLMSGFSSELLDADRDSPLAWELLRKPYSRSELTRAIAKVTSGRVKPD